MNINSAFSIFFFTIDDSDACLTFSGTRNDEYAKVRRFFQFVAKYGFARQSSTHFDNLFAEKILAPLGTLLRTLMFNLHLASRFAKSSNDVLSVGVSVVSDGSVQFNPLKFAGAIDVNRDDVWFLMSL